MSLKFSGNLLRKSRVTYNHAPKINFFIVYKLNTHTINTDFALKDCLFGSVRIAKDKDPDRYVYSVFGIGFDSTATFSHSDGTNAYNVIIFGADSSQSVHSTSAYNVIIFGADSSQSVHSSDKLAENVLVLGKGLVQKVKKQTVYVDHTFPTNFTKTDKKILSKLAL